MTFSLEMPFSSQICSIAEINDCLSMVIIQSLTQLNSMSIKKRLLAALFNQTPNSTPLNNLHAGNLRNKRIHSPQIFFIQFINIVLPGRAGNHFNIFGFSQQELSYFLSPFVNV